MENFRKGNKVLINTEHIKRELAEQEIMRKGMFKGLETPFNFFLESDRKPELLKRAFNNEIATITGTVGGDYANIIFNDGFECGVDFSGLIKVKK